MTKMGIAYIEHNVEVMRFLIFCHKATPCYMKDYQHIKQLVFLDSLFILIHLHLAVEFYAEVTNKLCQMCHNSTQF